MDTNDKSKRVSIPRTQDGIATATRADALMADLLGCYHHDGVAYTRDQVRALAKAYGFTLVVGDSLVEAGNRRNMMRRCERDGLRIMGLLARYLEPGEDPVQLVAQGLSEMGMDVELEEAE